jgi:hypothetical protein
MKEVDMKIVAVLFCLLFIAAFVAYAGVDVAGKWVAEVQAGEEKHTITFNLRTDGDRVTGTEGRSNGDAEIQDGRVKEDHITFTVTRNIGDRTLVLDYTGKIFDDKIEFTVKPRGPGWTTLMTAKRQK